MPPFRDSKVQSGSPTDKKIQASLDTKSRMSKQAEMILMSFWKAASFLTDSSMIFCWLLSTGLENI